MIASSSFSPRPPISYPMPVDIPSSTRLRSQTHKHQKNSLSGTMSWLTRSSSSPTALTPKQPYSVSKPVRISEPKFADMFSRQVPGNSNLGSGAIVVKTPQEALAGSGWLHNVESERKETRSLKAEVEGVSSHPRPSCPSPPESPPLPALPLSPNLLSPELSQELLQIPPRPIPSPQMPPPLTSSAPPVLESRSPSSSDLALSQPPFDAILLSDLPATPNDPSKTVVTLETCTQTYKTTLMTLTSRPSHLSEYFISLFNPATFAPQRDSEACSVYSQSSDLQDNLNSFNSIFHTHLTASGLLSRSSSSIHIFLDRPSAPYGHILSYLRTPPSPGRSSTLPRAVQLSTGASLCRIEALLELRDEANFLQLEELYILCTEELKSHRQKHAPTLTTIRDSSNTSGFHTRGASNVSTVLNNSAIPHILNGIEVRFEEDSASPALLHRMPTPSPSEPSSQTGSGYESPAGTLSHKHIGGSPNLHEVRKEGYNTVKSRPPPADWI